MTSTYTHHDGAPQTPSAPTASAVRAAPAALAPRDNPIFVVAARAAALRAQGIDVITLAAGEPDTPTAAGVVHAAQRAAADPALHHYGPAAGLPCLREAIAHATTAAGVPTDVEQVQVTLGAKHALFTALAGLTAPGDEVLVVTPGWPGHTEVVTAACATPVQVATTSATGFHLTPELLERHRCPRTRALILANPGNPTGVLHNEHDLRAIADWCAANGVHLVADEVYSQLTFDQAPVPAAAAAPEHRANITTIGAVSKAHAMTGWRVGWLITTPEHAAAARRHVAATITHVPGINQAAATTALTDTNTPAAARATYRVRRDRLVTALNAIDGVTCPTPGGGMFAFPEISDLLQPGQTATDLADHLLQTAHVATVPGDAFDAPNHLRVCFAVDDNTLDEAIERLTNALTHTPTNTPATQLTKGGDA